MPSRLLCPWVVSIFIFSHLSCTALAGQTFTELPVYAGWAFANADEQPSTDAEKVRLIQKHGYAGFMGCRIKSLSRVESAGSKVPGLYFGVDPLSEDFVDVLRRLDRETKGMSKQSGAVWLYFVHRDKNKTMNDNLAIDWLKRLASWSTQSGYQISLYPHSNTEQATYYWPNSTRALYYLQQADTEDFGMVFTVYHEVRQGRKDELEILIDQALPRIAQFAVAGPDLSEKSKANDDLYVRLFSILVRGHYQGGFLIYSRPYANPASEYLFEQKQAFEGFRQTAVRGPNAN